MFKTKRVVSLLPAATEMVCFLGASSQLVGRSHECDFPEEVRTLPACTASRIDSNASSAEIEKQVAALMTQKSPLYSVDVPLLHRLQPDVILTQAQCDVCAVSLGEIEQAVADWPGSKPQVVTLSSTRLAGVWEDIRKVSDAIDLGDDGRARLKALKNRVVGVIEKTCVVTRKPRVLCLEWISPLMVAGNWVPELVELAGGLDVIGKPGSHSHWFQPGQLAELNPEIIVIMPCGFGIQRARKELESIAQETFWKSLAAVRTGKVFAVDGNSYFNRPGPRLVESLEILTEIIQPKIGPFGHEGKAWERV